MTNHKVGRSCRWPVSAWLLGHLRPVRRRHGRHAAGWIDRRSGRGSHDCPCDRLVRAGRPAPDQARRSSADPLATGGVGQAAIAIARSVGAEIFATAGSDERRELLRSWGIKHVYDSRSTEFAAEIRRDTDGYGVDIVLNSVTGAAQRAAWSCWRSADGSSRSESATSMATPAGLVPVPQEPVVLRGRPGAALGHQSRRQSRVAEQGVRADRERQSADARGHRYPLAEAATAIREMSGARHTGKLIHGCPHREGAGRRPAAERDALPCGRCIRDNRWSRWSQVVPGGEDGRSRVWPDRSERAVRAEVGGGRGHRTDSQRRNRDRGGARRYRRAGHGSPIDRSGNGLGSGIARRPARGRPGRRRHTGQHHRSAHRPGLGPEGAGCMESASGDRRAAARLVLLVLVRRGAGRLTRPGCVSAANSWSTRSPTGGARRTCPRRPSRGCLERDRKRPGDGRADRQRNRAG